jgi:serine/threonine protein kinase
MMRKARHKNIVQMIGAHMGSDKKLIVFEYMSGGSVHDWLRKVSTKLSSRFPVMEVLFGDMVLVLDFEVEYCNIPKGTLLYQVIVRSHRLGLPSEFEESSAFDMKIVVD